MRLRNLCTLAAFVLVLSGCANLGNEKPDTFRQKLSYAEGVNAAVLEATNSSLVAGTLAPADARSIEIQADQAQLVLVAAKDAYAAGDLAGAQSKLAIAMTALQELQNYLRAKGAKP